MRGHLSVRRCPGQPAEKGPPSVPQMPGLTIGAGGVGAVSKLTHDYLNERGAMFLKYEKHCGVVAVELKSYATDSIPNVIGFKQSCSYLIESKVSRADYRADLKKPHRHRLSMFAVGNYRYYLCPTDLIQVEDLPEGWGLLWIEKKTITIIKEVDRTMRRGIIAEYRHEVHPRSDRGLLYSIARRGLKEG